MVSSKDMEPQPKPYLTPEEYLALERQAGTKHEYLDGRMFPLGEGFSSGPGLAFTHNVIIANLVGTLSQQVKNKSQIICVSCQRIHIPATGLYTYPDVIVVCGEPRLQDEHHDTLLNPTVIIEVLSPTTEAYGRGKKFEHYRSIDSLVEYLLVSQSEPHIEHYLRQDDNRWLFTETFGLEATLGLPTIQCELALADVYEKVVFDQASGRR